LILPNNQTDIARSSDTTTPREYIQGADQHANASSLSLWRLRHGDAAPTDVSNGDPPSARNWRPAIYPAIYMTKLATSWASPFLQSGQADPGSR